MKKLILLGLFLVLFAVGVNAFTVTLNTPATNEDSVSGTAYVLNATTADVSVYNCTFYAKSTSTANSTYGLLNATVTNTSSGQTEFTTNWDTTSVEDSNDYSFNATCYNEIGDIGVDTNTGIEIDNTVPTAPSSPAPADKSTNTNGSQAFSVAVTGSETTGCTLYFSGPNPGSSNYAMTHSGDTCTKSAIAFPEYTYYWYVIATDGTNTTTGTTYRVGVDISHAVPKAAYIEYMQQQGEIVSTGGPEFVIAKPKTAFSIIGATEMFGYNLKSILGIPILIWLMLIIIGGLIYNNYRKK